MATGLFSDFGFEILAALVPHLNENWWREGAYPSLPLRVSGNGDINDISLVHGGMSG